MIHLPFANPTDDLPSRIIRPATQADLSFVVHCQRQWSNNLGFLPRSTLARYIGASQVAVAEENGFPCGFVDWCGTSKGTLRVLQVAVEPDILRGHVGTDLMTMLRDFSIANELSIIRLTCRAELPANHFWPTVGFHPTAIYHRATTRKIPLIEWTKARFLVEQLTGVTLETSPLNDLTSPLSSHHGLLASRAARSG